MDIETKRQIDFISALRKQREAAETVAPETPELQQWLQYWNDEESFTSNMRNLSHWIACAKKQPQ